MTEEKMAAAVQPERKEIVTDVFVRGAKKGWGIAIGSMLPNVVMAFVIIKALDITGILTLVGNTCGPVMEIFGLPGKAIVVLLGAWLSAGGGVGTAIALHSSGSRHPDSCDLPDGISGPVSRSRSRRDRCVRQNGPDHHDGPGHRRNSFPLGHAAYRARILRFRYLYNKPNGGVLSPFGFFLLTARRHS